MPVRVRADIRVDLSGLQRYSRVVRTGGRPLNRVLKKWQKRYQTFIGRRYQRMSRGGWPALAPSTVKKKGRKLPILIDSGVLFRTIKPTFLRAPTKIGPLAIRVGFGKRAKRRHPGSKRKTIQQIAMFHQLGGQFLPMREIIVAPPIGVQRGFVTDLKTELGNLAKMTN